MMKILRMRSGGVITIRGSEDTVGVGEHGSEGSRRGDYAMADDTQYDMKESTWIEYGFS